MIVALKCLNSAGALVLDLNAGGYKAVTLPGADKTWRRHTAQSPFVDGTQEISAVLDGMVLDVQVRIRAGSWATIETLRAALDAATSGSPRWLLQITRGGVTEVWRADRADSSSPAPSHNLLNLQRDVLLRIPVQPTPAITGI